MKGRIRLVALLLLAAAQIADGSSLLTIGATKVRLSYEDPFAAGLIEVEAARGREGEVFYLKSLCIRARGDVYSIPPNLVINVPEPNLNSVELAFVPTEQSVAYITIEFGSFVEGAEPAYIRYRLNLNDGTAEVDFVSNDELLIE